MPGARSAAQRYKTGTAFERATRKHLEKQGYEVIRSAGSKGTVDLVAFKQGECLFVQCKLTAGLITLDAWNKLVTFAGYIGALPIVAVRAAVKDDPQYYRLTGPLAARQHRSPLMAHWTPDEVAEHAWRGTLRREGETGVSGDRWDIVILDDPHPV